MRRAASEATRKPAQGPFAGRAYERNTPGCARLNALLAVCFCRLEAEDAGHCAGFINVWED